MESQYHSAKRCKYLTQYHVIWCPKIRFPVLDAEVGDKLKEILRGICGSYGYEIKALEVMPDHIHLFVDVPQTLAPCDLARVLKSRSAIELFKAFPEMKVFYTHHGALWQQGHFISSLAQVSAETIRRYIEEQKHHGENNDARKEKAAKKTAN